MKSFAIAVLASVLAFPAMAAPGLHAMPPGAAQPAPPATGLGRPTPPALPVTPFNALVLSAGVYTGVLLPAGKSVGVTSITVTNVNSYNEQVDIYNGVPGTAGDCSTAAGYSGPLNPLVVAPLQTITLTFPAAQVYSAWKGQTTCFEMYLPSGDQGVYVSTAGFVQ